MHRTSSHTYTIMRIFQRPSLSKLMELLVTALIMNCASLVVAPASPFTAPPPFPTLIIV